jgi:hypothetical protein
MPAHSESSTSVPSQIALLRSYLDLLEAKDLEIRLRILTILGMLEVNYDSGMARQTWAEVESLANRRLSRRVPSMSRACSDSSATPAHNKFTEDV